MNQEKTGKFIANCRKKLNLTQEQLAEKIGITKNAVSKWERGLSFPDVSLYKKICTELNISIEELINGEEGNIAFEDGYSIEKVQNKIKRKSKKIIITIILMLMIIIIGLLYYNYSHKVNLITDSDFLYDIAIDYLKNQELKENPDSTQEDFNAFYAYHGFGIEEKGELKYAYMWVYSQSYFIEFHEALAISTGNSTPCKAIFKNDKIIRIEYPKNGTDYDESIKDLFPNEVAKEVLNFEKEKNVDKLYNEVANKKYIFYDYLNLDLNDLTIDDLAYDNLIFTINIGNKTCVPVQLNVYKDNKYVLNTGYSACSPGKMCNASLIYIKNVKGEYNYDIMQIIKHSVDANNMQFPMNNLPEYDIYAGNGHQFITDSDNKYLNEFLASINVDLKKCADQVYNR